MTAPDKIDTFLSSPTHYLQQVDWAPGIGNHSDTIDTQAEVDEATRLIFQANDPAAQMLFQKYTIPKINAGGWYVPALYTQALRTQLETCQTRNAINEEPIALGSVPVSVPYKINFGRLIQGLHIGWGSVASAAEQAETLVNPEGDVMLFIEKAADHQTVVRISSPLSPVQLRHALLWLPPNIQNDMVTLLGLPQPDSENVQRYVHQRITREELDSPQAAPIPSWWNCGLDRRDDQWKIPTTIRDALKSQCALNPSAIGFPEFGVSTATSASPILHTRGQYTCLVVMIYDRKTSHSLLAHLLTTDSWDSTRYTLDQRHDLACMYMASGKHGLLPENLQLLEGLSYRSGDFWNYYCHGGSFPYEWYASHFRRDYFGGSADVDLEITFLTAPETREVAGRDAILFFKNYFPQAKLQRHDSRFGRVESWLDSRTGNIYATSSYYYKDGYEEKDRVTDLKVVE